MVQLPNNILFIPIMSTQKSSTKYMFSYFVLHLSIRARGIGGGRPHYDLYHMILELFRKDLVSRSAFALFGHSDAAQGSNCRSEVDFTDDTLSLIPFFETFTSSNEDRGYGGASVA